MSIPWLVLMRDPAADALRIGHGTYRWTFGGFDATRRVTALHIHIEHMDVIADPHAKLLDVLQGELAYPWLSPDALRVRFQSLAANDASLAFAADFADTAALSTRRA